LPRAQTNYKSYMLRLWRVKDAKRYTWRVSLENVESGEITGFASLEKLIEFLQQLDNELEIKNDQGENGG
jgi:hypothetical protein